MQSECYKKQNDIKNGKLQQNNYASTSKNNEDNERLFVMQHVLNSVSAGNVSKRRDDVWYVDSGASNHMTSHAEWFNALRSPKKPRYVETGDDTAHPIKHVGNVPLSMNDGKVKYLADVLVPKKDEDDLALTASCASFTHRFTTSLAFGKRWYAETSAADEIDGFLSTMAALKKRSTPCAIDG